VNEIERFLKKGQSPTTKDGIVKRRSSEQRCGSLCNRCGRDGCLPSPPNRLVHPGRRHRLRRTWHANSCTWIYDGDCVADSCGSGLMDLQWGWRAVICGAWYVRRNTGIKGKPRSDFLRLLSRWWFGRSAGRRAIGWWRIDGNKLKRSNQTKRFDWHNGCDILTSASDNSIGQNSRSSSRSNDLPASNFCRKFVTWGCSAISFILLTPRNCLWLFWEVDRRGARRERPPWCACDEADCAVEGIGLWWAL